MVKAKKSENKKDHRSRKLKESRFSKTYLLIISLVFAAIGVYALLSSFAATTISPPSLYFNPDSSSVTQGGSVDVAIYEDSGSDTVNAVQANVNYPSNILTFNSLTSSSTFSLEAQCGASNCTASGGVIKIARATCAGCAAVSGPQLVATLHFTATSPGSADLSFAYNSSDPGTSAVSKVSGGLEALNFGTATFTVSGTSSSGGGTTSGGTTTSPPASSSSGSTSSKTSSSGTSSTHSSASSSSGGSAASASPSTTPAASTPAPTSTPTQTTTQTTASSSPSASEEAVAVKSRNLWIAGAAFVAILITVGGWLYINSAGGSIQHGGAGRAVALAGAGSPGGPGKPSEVIHPTGSASTTPPVVFGGTAPGNVVGPGSLPPAQTPASTPKIIKN